MKSILFLSVVMERGWGVSLEIGEICRRLRRDGVRAFAAGGQPDESFAWLDVEAVEAEAGAIVRLAQRLGADVIAAQTSPYFEVLPSLSDRFETWAWENGDPTPGFFAESHEERQQIIRYKRTAVYPRVHRVVAISDFVKHDIRWPAADVVRLGADHVPVRPDKSLEDIGHPESGALRIGTLMRLGDGEARYKGTSFFLQLAADLRALGIPVECHVAGRGTERDGAQFRERGILPHLNLSDEERTDYLRSLDVFVSMSLWEGFNLPLVEAQAVGTFALGLDVGAHPEVCPFLMRHPNDAVRYITRGLEDHAWLRDQSALCSKFVRSQYSWDSTARQVASLLRTSRVPVGRVTPTT
jgi:glycosyltransferase involved in cell wall biosynthesis